MSKQTRVSTGDSTVSGWTGWVLFASFMLGIAAVFQIVAGLTAILQEGAFLITEQNLILLDYQQWGWTHVILGFFVLAASFALASGKLWGRIVGVVAAVLSVVANFMFIQAYPVWSILIILIDFMVIYGIVMHGGELKEA